MESIPVRKSAALSWAPGLIIAGLMVVLGSIGPEVAAEEEPPAERFAGASVPASRAERPQVFDGALAAELQKEAGDKEPGAKEPASGSKKFDPEVIRTGEAAFNRGCIKCHDAARSLNKTKSYSDWLSTVRRMAAMRDANIPASDIVPITTYLASRNPEAAPPGEGTGGAFDKSSFSTFLTITPNFRTGSANVQDGLFVPEAWFGAAWHGKILSARVSGCVSCHVNKFEVLEAAARVDFSQWLEPVKEGTRSTLDAGKFIVPFSAISSAPMEYHTVSRPLIFTMGQWVHSDLIGQSVLPMPYVDSGIDLNASTVLCHIGDSEFRVGWDGYVINGLTGTNTGIDWANSRNNYDLNVSPTLGTRITAGTQMLRFGASYMSGYYNQPGTSLIGSMASTTTTPLGPGQVTTADQFAGKLGYYIYGFDVVAHYEDLVRFQFEYAKRSNERFDSAGPGQGRQVFNEATSGYYFELEGRPKHEFPVSGVVRYDRFERSSALSPAGSFLPGSFNIQRFTWGINVNLWQNSLLMFNHERWFFSNNTGLDKTDVFGLRYSLNF